MIRQLNRDRSLDQIYKKLKIMNSNSEELDNVEKKNPRSIKSSKT
jgi:hypothetical protein